MGLIQHTELPNNMKVCTHLYDAHIEHPANFLPRFFLNGATSYYLYKQTQFLRI